ncbi:MAG: HD domain-containing protein [Gammaproteobacteria bacterium]
MPMNRLPESIYVHAEQYFNTKEKCHDWSHVLRVTKLAKYISEREAADNFLVEICALLHDVGDWKFQEELSTKEIVYPWLREIGLNDDEVEEVISIIIDISFKGAQTETKALPIEGKIVQDADRLDAIGAIGIARAFTYGGHVQRPLYNPSESPKTHKTFEEYKKYQSTTINHFYEKLLLLKDRLHTDTAREIAQERHEYMEAFLKQFYKEWEVV